MSNRIRPYLAHRWEGQTYHIEHSHLFDDRTFRCVFCGKQKVCAMADRDPYFIIRRIREPEQVAPNDGQIVPKLLLVALAVACVGLCVGLCVLWFR